MFGTVKWTPIIFMDTCRCGQLFSVLFLATYNKGDVGKGEISGDICKQGLQLL